MKQNVSTWAIAIFFAACTSTKPITTEGVPAYVPESRELHDTIVKMDSLFFDSSTHEKVFFKDLTEMHQVLMHLKIN